MRDGKQQSDVPSPVLPRSCVCVSANCTNTRCLVYVLVQS